MALFVFTGASDGFTALSIRMQFNLALASFWQDLHQYRKNN
ncbi:hypothetical protein VIBHAR_02561 [Vibrio campbellii ATCC BAA-1116]|uniref:Uncharacterized protein n=1 Tax=Vibrio campbellii (strain ATCC BAA-1116) TaxID=2902295 RepID=A7MYJ5_VIBC1|nr:hypothetical protein VIBHAR_02561 [Vibrio campbellii ATCC BAA-1116]